MNELDMPLEERLKLGLGDPRPWWKRPSQLRKNGNNGFTSAILMGQNGLAADGGKLIWGKEKKPKPDESV